MSAAADMPLLGRGLQNMGTFKHLTRFLTTKDKKAATGLARSITQGRRRRLGSGADEGPAEGR